MADNQPNTDDIIRYLGYEVHPGKIGEFWKSEDEKKQYLQRVRARGGQLSIMDREEAILNTLLMTGADKIIGIVGSVLLIISFLFPAYSFTMYDKAVSGSAISFFVNLPLIGGYASWGGEFMVLGLAVYALILIACPIAGVMNLIGLFNKHQGDSYFHTVKEYSRFVFVPFYLYILLVVILLYGAPQPFGSLGIDAIGQEFNLAAIFKLTGQGFWLNIAGIAIVLAERRGL
jgi:hypothetical protein